MDGQSNKKYGVRCCFCNQGIKESAVDPLDISVISNEEKGNPDSFQLFYAHFICFKQKLHKDIQGYFVSENDDNE